jgi:uncharacterized HhH-GPD family protein
MATTTPTQLPWTTDEDANRLLAEDPNALLIGFALDQQVPVPKAFSGPYVLKQRLGHLDPARIAVTPPEQLDAVFRERPAIHRFPGAMAERVQALCRFLAERYDGDGSRVWREAATGTELTARIGELPGFGDMKVRSLTATLIKQFGVKPDGWEAVLPGHPTLGDVTTPAELEEYQAAKREYKRQVRDAQQRKG